MDESGENSIVVGAGANLFATAKQVPDSLLGPETVLMLQMEVSPAQNWELISREGEGTKIILNVAPAGMVPDTVLKSIDILAAEQSWKDRP